MAPCDLIVAPFRGSWKGERMSDAPFRGSWKGVTWKGERMSELFN